MQVAVRTDWEPALGHYSPCSGVPVYSTNSTQEPVSNYLSLHSKHALETAPLILNNHLVWNHLIRRVCQQFTAAFFYTYSIYHILTCLVHNAPSLHPTNYFDICKNYLDYCHKMYCYITRRYTVNAQELLFLSLSMVWLLKMAHFCNPMKSGLFSNVKIKYNKIK